ncbi:unnamed protein product [Clonostachys solani]|uniref:Uncharacterized protein n=1 Tax=Clonostachys solani TaxID=160281 RepID=A0A9N9VV54_9HYPO|nr:unnamed protein product [Clonostachys solani]
MKSPAFILGFWPIFFTLCCVWGADAAHPSTVTDVLDNSTPKLEPEYRLHAEQINRGEDDASISYGYPDPYGPITYGSNTCQYQASVLPIRCECRFHFTLAIGFLAAWDRQEPRIFDHRSRDRFYYKPVSSYHPHQLRTCQ